jgi:glycosyltransferase involved in cell wall biosynthesis
MKILHLTKISVGGAFVAANRISDSLNQIGHDSRVEVMDNFSSGPLKLEKIQAKLDFINESVSSASITTSMCRSYSLSGHKFESLKEVDVVNLHWIPGLLHKEFIEQMSKIKRVIWTMHDMNTFTGICHHSSECRNFEDNCFPCPQFAIPRLPVPSLILREKIRYLEKIPQTSFIAPSEWLKELALSSTLLRDQVIDVIPNPTSSALIEHKEGTNLRERLGFASDALVVGVLGTNYGVQKGGKKAFEEVKLFAIRAGVKIQILVFGKSHEETDGFHQVSTLDHTDIAFEDFLQTCDLYVHLSEYENLPNIIIEAQSLGVPVIALDRGGVSETMAVGVTGYVIKEIAEFKDGMDWFLCASKDANLKNLTRMFAQSKFDQSKIAKQYIDVYSR